MVNNDEVLKTRKIIYQLLHHTEKTNLRPTGVREKLQDNIHGIKNICSFKIIIENFMRKDYNIQVREVYRIPPNYDDISSSTQCDLVKMSDFQQKQNCKRCHRKAKNHI